MTRRSNSRFPLQIIALLGTSAAFAFVIWMIRRYAMPIRETQIHVSATQTPPSTFAAKPGGSRPLQLLDQGEGDLFHRLYQVDIDQPEKSAEQLMREIYTDINAFVPIEMLRFDKMRGADTPDWQIGDEFYIHVTGPWDAPVRVIEVEPTQFALLTLEDHFEAGEIHFGIIDHPDKHGAIRFEIESWARSRDVITDFAYRVLGFSKFAQTRVWTYFCKRVLEQSGGELIDVIRVTTHKTRYEPETPIPAWKRYQNDFARWRETALNFDPSQRESFTEGTGWRIDDYSTGLPSEPPGSPLPDGSWAAARKIVENYEFPDPNLITGIFVPDEALDQRIMIIRARFLMFTFLFGVKIVNVSEETRDTEKRGKARVWGYGYRTLQGHFEMGEIRFEVWKFMDSGEVEFRVHAYSKVAHIPNPFYRIGFGIFGRGLQKRFARTALTRMQQLVIARTTPAPTPSEAIPEPAPEVQPASTDTAASEKAEEITGNQD